LKSKLPDSLLVPSQVPDDVAAELRRVEGRLGRFARPLHWMERTTSTNEIAARLAELGAQEGTTVVADTQTAGRGRLGRAWFSPPGAGLYVSIVLKPRTGAKKGSDPFFAITSLLTLASGVALAEGVRASTGLPTELKWPNDLMVLRRKLAGILAEAAHGHGVSYVVLGFGINLRLVAYPRELADRVTSLEAEAGKPVDRAMVFAEILAALAERYADLQAGRFDAILTAWRALAPSLRMAPVEWESPSGFVRGHAEDIDPQGALLIRIGNRLERVIAGEVRWL
jgi:BirA family biotin operon repressor/biotin-[acetyl-CoA-carboxylase] ligase